MPAGADYNLAEVAKALGLSTESVRMEIAAGRLKGRKSGQKYLFTYEELEQYLGRSKAAELFGSDSEYQSIEKRIAKTIAARTHKKCRMCGKLKPMSDFPVDYSYFDRRKPDCAECVRGDVKSTHF